MKVAVCVAGYHRGNTGEYVLRACTAAGHETTLLGAEEFYHAIENESFEFFFCVDSGETFDFSRLPKQSFRDTLAMWFIDYRHNKDRPERVPNDRQNAKELAARNATIFQAQYEDYEELTAEGVSTCAWLPMAADPEIWSDIPQVTEKKFAIGFVGNVWDQNRKVILEHIMRSGLSLGFPGHGAAWMEDAAALLRSCHVGFNVSSFYGSPIAYDLNMRFFETLSCGVPLVTNWVPSIGKLFPSLPPFLKVYNSPQEILPTLRAALSDKAFLSSGPLAREWLLNTSTYYHRLPEILTKRT